MTSVFKEKNIPKAILRAGLPAMPRQLTTPIYIWTNTYFVSMMEEPNMSVANIVLNNYIAIYKK